MDQILNTEQKDFFSKLVANPQLVGPEHQSELQQLVNAHPQSSVLRAMLARASQTNSLDVFQQKLKSAAVYAPDRSVLYNFINYPEKLSPAIKVEQPTTIDAPVAAEESLITIETPELPEAESVVQTEPAVQDEEVIVASANISDAPVAPQEALVVESPQNGQIYPETNNIAESYLPPTTQPITLIDEFDDDDELPDITDESNFEELIFAQYGWINDADKQEKDQHSVSTDTQNNNPEPSDTNDGSKKKI